MNPSSSSSSERQSRTLAGRLARFLGLMLASLSKMQIEAVRGRALVSSPAFGAMLPAGVCGMEGVDPQACELTYDVVVVVMLMKVRDLTVRRKGVGDMPGGTGCVQAC